jgi:hypothetical protein
MGESMGEGSTPRGIAAPVVTATSIEIGIVKEEAG